MILIFEILWFPIFRRSRSSTLSHANIARQRKACEISPSTPFALPAIACYSWWRNKIR